MHTDGYADFAEPGLDKSFAIIDGCGTTSISLQKIPAISGNISVNQRKIFTQEEASLL